MKQENGLQYVFFLMDEQWEEEKNVLKDSLEQEGIGCLDVEVGIECEAHRIEWCNKKRCILLTDQKSVTREAADLGIVCIGLNKDLNSFFDGAVLVCDSLDSLDAQTLEETYLRAKGIPVTIAETERLILREIAKEDIEELCRISRLPGMEYLMPEGKAAEEFFNEENLRGYIDTVYRFYGYGLWSVWKKDGILIGCCGLQDYIAEREGEAEQECEAELGDEVEQKCEIKKEKNAKIQEFVLIGHLEKDSEVSACLELQYMLAPQYHQQGFGFEMCRAALGFAFARTDAQQIVIRCHRENTAAAALAKKLLEWRPFSV